MKVPFSLKVADLYLVVFAAILLLTVTSNAQLRSFTGLYVLPVKLNGSFDINSCLGCHAGAASFRAVEAHQAPDLQEALLNHTMSCTGTCHPAAHPDSALTGGKV